MIVARTTAICNRCNASHDAEIVRREDCMVGVVNCPAGPCEYSISSDAELYLQLRGRCFVDPGEAPPLDPRNVLNYISITNACNFHCAICGANAKYDGQEPVFLSTEEICRRATEVKRRGGRLLHLIGGEPTLHTDLLPIVRRLRHMGFSVGMVTNGYLLGTDESLVRRLKAHGLARVCMQFDSFDERVLERYDRSHLEEKRRAIRHVIDTGLKLGLNATVTRHNLPELAALLEHGLELGPAVVNMTFASAAPVGRYHLTPQESVDRESMVTALLRAGSKYHFSLDDVMPLPSYAPWRLQVHPDCGVHIVLVRTPRGIWPLNYFVDLWEIYRRMHESWRRRKFRASRIGPVAYLLGGIRKARWRDSLRVATALLLRRPGYGIVNVGVSNYHGAVFLDEQRITRCASAFYTSVGPVKGCLHFFRDAQFPGSREYEVLHGSC
jgi:MoaA/NifB/PqqE/SkfB family radical SAM enzyme